MLEPQKSLDYSDNFAEINRNLTILNDGDDRRKQFIISIFIIPAFFWIYNFLIEASNYLYWVFLRKSYLGFLSSPIETPLMKIYIAIILILLGSYCFLNFSEKKDKANGLLLILNTFFTLIPYFLLLAFLVGIKNINIEHFAKGESLLWLSLLNKNSLIIIIVGIIGVVLITIIVKKNNAFFCIAGISMLLFSGVLSYVTYEFLNLHQSFITKKFKESTNYIYIEDSSSKEDYYVVYCETKCFGYEVINKGSVDYELRDKVFSPEAIKHR